jgi:hypothetical protein
MGKSKLHENETSFSLAKGILTVNTDGSFNYELSDPTELEVEQIKIPKGKFKAGETQITENPDGSFTILCGSK